MDTFRGVPVKPPIMPGWDAFPVAETLSAQFGAPVLVENDANVAAVAARGLEPDERLTYSNGVRKALYRDPDGNELGFGGAPLDTGS